MALPSQIALSSDPSKVNPTAVSPEDLSEYQQSLQDQIKSLEQRYENPNWFKVAAGFLKPQLGGFAASLGSASEALGENVQAQREAALPIAQMRSQLAQSKILTGQNKTQSDEYEAWRVSGKPMDQATFTRLFSLNPTSPVAEAVKAAYEGQRKDLEYTSGQQRLMMDAIQMKQAKGMPLSAQEQAFLSGLPGQLSLRQEAKPLLPGGEPTGASGPTKFDPRLQGDLASIQRELSRLPAGDPRRSIIEKELQVTQQAIQAQGTTPSIEPSTETSEKKGALYPPTFKFPDVSSLGDQERTSVTQAHQRNVEAAEKKSEERINQLRTISDDPTYSALNSEYQAAIDLLSTKPKQANKIFNLLRGKGDLLNQVLSSAQAGLGVNLGSMSASLNFPVEAFLRAGLNEEEQIMADRLLRAMITVGNAKLTSQGITPEKGQESYKQILDATKASFQQNPVTALHNLQKDYVNFQQSKKLHDQAMKEYSQQQQYSSTPYTDIFKNSPKISKINEDARKEMAEYESGYKEYIRRLAEKRQSSK